MDVNNAIIINKSYFNTIEKCVDSLNQFFSSNFQQKNLLKVDDSTNLDIGMQHILDSIDTIDPRWLNDSELVADAAEKINEVEDVVKERIMTKTENGELYDFFSYCEDENNESLLNVAKEFLSFKALEQISDNISDFEKLLNGIYSFELFTNPSKYRKEVELFTQNVPMGECSDVLGSVKYSIFDIKDYVNGIFENDDIDVGDLDVQKETERVLAFNDINPNIKVVVNDSVQEAAEVNYFASTKPSHIKYSNGKWHVSAQFEKWVDKLISELRKCNSSDDLVEFFQNDKFWGDAYDPCNVVAPFILVKVMSNTKKFPYDTFAIEDYTKSYKSIISNNNGAKRFENYDIFTTFKSDKEGTLRFISDFCKLTLVNNPKAVISNNTLLTLFNIFDSRIYFDIMYNMIPDKEKRDKGMDEDSFVRKQRAIINNNSRNSNPYQTEVNTSDVASTSKEINEYTSNMIRSMGDMDISDMSLCESWHDMLREEIMTVDDGLYNAGIPISATYDYIGESFDVIDSISNEMFMESAEERKKVVAKTVLGGLIGNFGLEALGLVTPIPGVVTLIELLVFGKLGMAVGAVIANSIAKKSRGKSIKSEIVRDTNSIVTALSKETDEIDDYIIRDLKKRARNLAETLSFAIKRKDLFKEDDREKLVDLHHAVININTKLDADNQEKNKSIISNFFKSANAVLEMITKLKADSVSVAVFNDVEETDKPEEPSETETNESDKTEESVEDKSDDNDDSDDEEKEVQEAAIQEIDDGSIPEYMRTRMKITDEGNNPRKPTIEPVKVPSNDGDVPSNSIDDLSMSIDAKVNAADDDINDVIGKESKKEGTNIVYNVTNNYTYTNSFNKTNNDFSTNKHTDSSIHSDKNIDLSNKNDMSNKDTSNNKYNSTGSSDTKDAKRVQEFSTGYSVEEVFAFLNSEEPLLEASGTKPPKEDSLTKAMDRDRKTLPKQQAAKKTVDKAVGTAKAVTKPIVRTKHWLLGIVDSLVKRREDKVKAEIIQNPSYRTALYKACRIAIKIGLTGVAFTVSGYLGAAYLLLQASNAYDKQRMRTEVESEFATEIKILDKKIQQAEDEGTPESRQAMYKMMRLRNKMERIATKEAPGAKIKHPSAVQ